MTIFFPRYLLALSLLFFTNTALISQNAPITTCSTVSGVVPGACTVDITVTNFTGIGAISLSLDYDHSVMHFESYSPHPQLPTFQVGDNDLSTGYHRLTMAWYGAGASLADGSIIMTLTFTFISGITTINWYDNGPSCEYADSEYNVLNDLPAEYYYINGYVCGAIGTPGPITGNDSVCPGQAGEVYSIDQVENATGYYWSLPPGAILVTGQGTNSIIVDFPVGAATGIIAIYGINPCGDGPVSELEVVVNELPVADAGEDFTINYGTSTTLNAAPGGSGVYAYHWSPEELLVDPDVQNPQTVILTETAIFNVLVTDLATFCQDSDNVIVYISGGPLVINPVAIPGIICQEETSQLFANAGGGSEDYGYTWTCDPPGDPPWMSNLPSPIVSPDVSTEYLVEVFDGFNTVFGPAFLSVLPLPTATIYGGDTLCGEDETTTLQVDLTGTPPWSFTYSFGSTSVNVYDQQTTPYLIIASEPGDYIITVIEDVNCSGLTYGNAMVYKYPIPETPEITVYFMELISSSCCGNQWYLNNELIPGATEQTYSVTVSGQYYVIVTMNSCSSEPSEVVDMIVGIPEINAGMLNIYPNPAKDMVYINYSSSDPGSLNIRLFSMEGRVIKDIQTSDTGPDRIYQLDLKSLQPGLYVLKVSTKSGEEYAKVVVSRD